MTGYFVKAGVCFASPMNDIQRYRKSNMEHSVRQFMLMSLSDHIISGLETDLAESERVEFLLERMKGEFRTVGGIGSRDVLIGYVLLDDQDTIMHRMLFDEAS